MAAQVLQDLIDEVAAEHTQIASAVVYIQGVPKLIADAVAAAIAGGATAADLAPLSDLVAQMKKDGQATVDAILANTPSPPPSPAFASFKKGKP